VVYGTGTLAVDPVDAVDWGMEPSLVRQILPSDWDLGHLKASSSHLGPFDVP